MDSLTVVAEVVAGAAIFAVSALGLAWVVAAFEERRRRQFLHDPCNNPHILPPLPDPYTGLLIGPGNTWAYRGITVDQLDWLIDGYEAFTGYTAQDIALRRSFIEDMIVAYHVHHEPHPRNGVADPKRTT